MITILIPTYNQPQALNLCLESIVKTQQNKNQIIVVENGYNEKNQPIFNKYKEYIDILPFKENIGLNRALNLGVCNASYDKVLVVHDDMVFPQEFDQKLLNSYQPNSVLAPNTIEPTPSMFKQFIFKDCGTDPNTFDLKAFWEYEKSIKQNKIDDTGSTFPFLISKQDYLKVGGWDESYPGPWVVDWEFFMKCEMNGMKMLRTYDCNFYHFVSLSTKSPEQLEESDRKEQECHEYFKYKWGVYAQTDPINNSKLI